MEDVIESTFSLLSFHPKHTPPGTERALEPAHLLALLDIRATWFKKWMVSFPQRCDCAASLLSYFPLCLSPSARRLQSDRGSQTAAEQIQVSGEHMSSSGSCFYDREVRDPKEPTEPSETSQQP